MQSFAYIQTQKLKLDLVDTIKSMQGQLHQANEKAKQAALVADKIKYRAEVMSKRLAVVEEALVQLEQLEEKDAQEG